jgi:hypothetical protein
MSYADGEIMVCGNGDEMAYSGYGPTPENIISILKVRLLIGDPVAGNAYYVEELPAAGLSGYVYTTGGGAYWVYEDAWEKAALKFSDTFILDQYSAAGVYGAAVKCVDNYIMRLDPEAYMQSMNAGAQTLSFASFADVLNYWQMKRAMLKKYLDAAAGLDGVRCFRARRRAVGGGYE